MGEATKSLEGNNMLRRWGPSASGPGLHPDHVHGCAGEHDGVGEKPYDVATSDADVQKDATSSVWRRIRTDSCEKKETFIPATLHSTILFTTRSSANKSFLFFFFLKIKPIKPCKSSEGLFFSGAQTPFYLFRNPANNRLLDARQKPL